MASKADNSAQVLVAGAGPSGFVLALALLQNGVRVRIIEKDPNTRVGQRGAAIMPRSLELFNTLGVAQEIENQGIFSPRVRVYELPEGVKLLQTFDMQPHTNPTPACPYPNIMLLGQDKLEDILRSTLAQHSCYVEHGAELRSYEQHPDRVSAHIVQTVDGQEVSETADFEWLVGADGARGVVRKLLGLSFLGETRSMDNLVVGDIRVNGLGGDNWHMWGDASTTLISLRPTETPFIFNFVIAGRNVNHAELISDHATLVEFLHENTGRRDLLFGESPWLSHYTPNIRMVDKFGEGRVFVAGDAAHVHSPTGGQGMNSGIQDSFNLAWKLALVVHRHAPSSLLQTYTEERLPVIAEMLNQTTAILNKTLNHHDKSRSLNANANGKGASGKSGMDESAWKRGGSLLQLGVNCRWSSIVLDEQVEGGDTEGEESAVDSYGTAGEVTLRAGNRAPDAPGLVGGKIVDESLEEITTRLFSVFGSSYHTILVFANPNPTISYPTILKALKVYPRGTVRSVVIYPQGTAVPSPRLDADFVLVDTEGHAHDAYALDGGCTIVAVRPDGVVGAIVKGTGGLERYFEGIFGRRRA